MYRYLFAVSTLAIITASSAQAHDGEAHKHHHLRMDEGHFETGLQIGGFHNFQTGWVDEDMHPRNRDVRFRNDTEIHVHYNGQADNGLQYGMAVELEADVTEADREEGVNADKTYLFLQGTFGRVELGSNSDAGHALGVDASTFARATGGAHGDYDNWITFPHHHGHGGGSHSHTDFIHAPGLPLASQHGPAEDANKLTYYTPVLSGVQGGVSFIPDSGDVGTAAGFTTDADDDQFENVVNGAIQYQTQVGAVGVLASVSGEFGSAESAMAEDLAALGGGINLSYAGFTIGGSYHNWGDTFTMETDNLDDGFTWTAGVGYETGPYGISYNYLNSELKENAFNTHVVGVDYGLAPGLTPYAEIYFFDADIADATESDNNGMLLLSGINLAF